MSGKRFRCSIGRHRWVLRDDHFECLYCHRTRPRRKRLLCYVGLHNWIPMQKAEARYLACRHCGKYGGDPGRWFPSRYRE